MSWLSTSIRYLDSEEALYINNNFWTFTVRISQLRIAYMEVVATTVRVANHQHMYGARLKASIVKSTRVLFGCL